VALLITAAGAAMLAFIALEHIGLTRIAASLLASSPGLVLVGLGLMCLAMVMRGFAWYAILRAALPRVRVRRRDAMRGTFIGVLMSSTLPARLGEPSRALILARRLGRPRETLPVVLGTLVSQTLLNLVALGGLGIAMFSSVNLFNGHHDALLIAAVAPVGVALAVLLAPTLVPRVSRRSQGPSRRQALLARVRGALTRARDGLSVFRQPRRAAAATTAQLAAWGLQLLSCYVLLAAFGLDDKAGLGAAAAVLFAVNVTAVLPATPANLGVFQAACVVVLAGAYHVSTADALGYGIVLQAVEVATAVLMGMPALLHEGLSWRDMRMRTMHVAPVKLPAVPQGSRSAGGHAKARA
jgi:phosphatidylinositol alpha-mannosyltransferase